MRVHPIIFTGPRIPRLLDQSKTQTRRLLDPQPIDLPEGAYCDPYNGDFGKFTFWTADNRMCNGQIGNVKGTCHWRCPYGQPSDLLYVKEPWRIDSWNENDGTIRVHYLTDGNVSRWLDVPDEEMFQRWWIQSSDDCAKAGVKPGDDDRYDWPPGGAPTRKRNARFLPRWASRITCELTNVRPQRVRDISEADAIAEGYKPRDWGTWWQGYRDLGTGDLVYQQSRSEEPPAWMIEPKRMNNLHINTTAAQEFRADWILMHGLEAWDSWVWALTFNVHLANVNTVLESLTGAMK